MEEQDTVEPEYLKGFNEGYTIAQHKPELAEKLASIDSDFIRLVGFKAGREQFQKEQMRERLPSWLKGDRSTREQGKTDKTKGRDIEPDRE
ncbi:hypothetical protein [Spirosoma pollinicola]|uniref:Uncharacterized protein n=1 Tax=Spirosoma pollinicola TaxID=2057025 RepID=A0A2K8YX06_9BACT|nr:hypothetical protein [Spirosoma pollinicola]AUD02170.1 hypothetical protein CWM47_10265 [Spirosoma pollinicola]